jgi:hypothetical protein
MTDQTFTSTNSAGLADRYKLVPVSELRPSPHNARKHSPAQIRKLARSIELFHFNAPVLADKNGNILAGHGRVQAAQMLGMAEVPVVYLDHLTEEQAKAYMLADNKLTDLSNWDDEKLAIQLKDMSEMALSFEIEATGFDSAEIDFRIQSRKIQTQSIVPIVSSSRPAIRSQPSAIFGTSAVTESFAVTPSTLQHSIGSWSARSQLPRSRIRHITSRLTVT